MDPISPLKQIICLLDRQAELVQIYEEHSRGVCRGAAAWTAYHYKNTSDLVLDSYRDGPRDVLLLKVGEGGLHLTPSFSSAGIEEVKVLKDRVEVTYAGLGGAGVGITKCRKGVSGVLSSEAFDTEKMGKCKFTFKAMTKLHIGLDDTDSGSEGATWSLANELGVKVSEMEGVTYLNHTLVQLYPFAPHKTTNCVGTVLTFAVAPEKEEELVETFTNLLKESTSSDQTGMAVFKGIDIPPKLKDISKLVRTRMVTVEETEQMADLVQIIRITGENGIIGSVGVLGMSEKHEEAVIPGIPYEKQ